jgi:hypothetical protein
MARDHECNGIAGTGTGYCPRGFRFADRCRYLAIRLHGAVRDRLRVIPNPHLESCGSDVERQVEVWLSSRDVFGQRGDPAIEFARVSRGERAAKDELFGCLRMFEG